MTHNSTFNTVDNAIILVLLGKVVCKVCAFVLMAKSFVVKRVSSFRATPRTVETAITLVLWERSAKQDFVWFHARKEKSVVVSLV